MDIPFEYGRIVAEQNFINRRAEKDRLKMNFSSNINSILISPRRWGKSSLVHEASKELELENKSVRVCHLDFYKVRTPTDFYEILISGLLNVTNTRIDDFIARSKKVLKSVLPKFSFSPMAGEEISIGFDWEDIEKSQDQLLDFAEELAKSKKIKLVIAIDEFQNINSFKDPLAFQKRLRSNWQKHQHVTYCLYGSKRHMMMELFSKQNLPFYKFGDLIFLEKIDESHWVDFILDNFKRTNKSIKPEEALRIVQLADRHSYYVQQLAQLVWLRTKKSCTSKIVEEAHQSLLDQLSLLFINITDDLSNTQVGFLKALIDGVERFTTQKNLKLYKLGTSANVSKIKKALEEREVVDFLGKRPEFNDPMYKNWLAMEYFR